MQLVDEAGCAIHRISLLEGYGPLGVLPIDRLGEHFQNSQQRLVGEIARKLKRRFFFAEAQVRNHLFEMGRGSKMAPSADLIDNEMCI